MTAPIPRSPPLLRQPHDFSTGEPLRPKTPAIPEDEELPFPYSYTIDLVPADEREAIREQFIHDANLKRWRHIYQAEVKVKAAK